MVIYIHEVRDSPTDALTCRCIFTSKVQKTISELYVVLFPVRHNGTSSEPMKVARCINPSTCVTVLFISHIVHWLLVFEIVEVRGRKFASVPKA